jgi:glutamate synthase (NADPH) large chain
MYYRSRPKKRGLYDPDFERESCGVGFVAHIKGRKSSEIISLSGQVLKNMSHRGAVGSDKDSGDGAGILIAMPQDYLTEEAARNGIILPKDRPWACGILFLPKEKKKCKEGVTRIVEEENCKVLGFRKVPVEHSCIGKSALACEPAMEMIFIEPQTEKDDTKKKLQFAQRLFLIRKRAVRDIRGGSFDPDNLFYIPSLSETLLVYKGMLKPEQLFCYFPDLQDPRMKSHLAMVHSRFSTNTFPSWDRAQPLRMMCHNGEINTLRGNINKMKSRQGQLFHPSFGDDLKKAYPIIEPDCSDSGNFDNVLELLVMGGRNITEAVMMMNPEAWLYHKQMPDIGKAMYEYFSCLIEPWDGPASIAFTDGKMIGAVLDRNGLRPSRYYVTDDDIVIMASEAGVGDIPNSKIRMKGRLQPGRMFLVDFTQGRIIGDEELKVSIAESKPFRKWLNEQRIELYSLAEGRIPENITQSELQNKLKLFGYTQEHLELILKPMAENHKEPLGSMGNDTPLACLSKRPRLIYDYFKQLFAQVTNPPIDSIREYIVMSLESFIGPEGNLLNEESSQCNRLHISNPILTNSETAKIIDMNHRGWKTIRIDMTMPVNNGDAELEKCLDRICRRGEKAVRDGYAIIVLSDRKAGPNSMPAGALLACGALHQHLLRKEMRTKIGIIIESGEPREVHHFCALLGYGADGINPYLAFEVMWQMSRDGMIRYSPDTDEIEDAYIDALSAGMRKVFGKMGISTLNSYKGAQIFEAIGLGQDIIKRCFTGTPSRIGGVSFDILSEELKGRHRETFPLRNTAQWKTHLNAGEYKWRRDGEKHMWDPESIANLRIAVQNNSQDHFKKFSEIQDARSKNQAVIRGLLNFKESEAIPVDEVESIESIMKRFVTGAMSFGSISQEAHEAIAVAMNRIGGKSNTGEGGEDPRRFNLLPNGDSKRSAIKQIASGRFGVTANYLTNADEIQIKMAQGAKPGEGGELPGHKVLEVIAKTRYSTPGVGLISPPPHHDIYSIEDLAQLIFDLKNANPSARISVKLVSEVGVGTVAAGVAKAHADHILISGHDGGTGASPLTGIRNAGLPWELGIAETHQTLIMNDLRSRVVLQTDGQIKTAKDVVTACLLGAEEWGFASTALITLGCIMMRKCEKNTCPVGIATQDPELRKKFRGKPEYLERYFRFLARDVRKMMASLGFRNVNEMVGRADLLIPDPDVRHWKSRGVSLDKILEVPVNLNPESKPYASIGQDHGIDNVLDHKLIEKINNPAFPENKVTAEYSIKNRDRAVGTMTSHVVTKRFGENGLEDGKIHIKLSGSAGQSFGAWLVKGITLELQGDSNDYIGKGLCGGRIVVKPPEDSRFIPEENIIIGNVSFYGATSGEAYIQGKAAERFCVRNSGAWVVIEGIGDHGCEYMTGGRAVILGETGRNFAAGMSGGIAYVWNPKDDFRGKINSDFVELGSLYEEEDIQEVIDLIQKHRDYTGSSVAEYILRTWQDRLFEFVKVIPPDYRRIMIKQQEELEGVVNG